jgi:hypothetical protein
MGKSPDQTLALFELSDIGKPITDEYLMAIYG